MRRFGGALAALGMVGMAALIAPAALAQNCSVWLVESSRFMNVPYGAFMPDRVFVPGSTNPMNNVVKEPAEIKEMALNKVLDIGVSTVCGEFMELVGSSAPIGEIKKEDIYRVYDLKTAYYTFSCPLYCGALLSRAGKRNAEKLFEFGRQIGRAFQIRNDVSDIFSGTDEANFSDIIEGKRTIIAWYSFCAGSADEKLAISEILSKKQVSMDDCRIIKDIFKSTGAVNFAKGEIFSLFEKAESSIKHIDMSSEYKETLKDFCGSVLKI